MGDQTTVPTIFVSLQQCVHSTLFACLKFKRFNGTNEDIREQYVYASRNLQKSIYTLFYAVCFKIIVFLCINIYILMSYLLCKACQDGQTVLFILS